jgi:hypothetical protein
MGVEQMPEEADRERATREGDRPRVRIVDVPSEGRPSTVTMIQTLPPEARKRARAIRRKEPPPEG